MNKFLPSAPETYGQLIQRSLLIYRKSFSTVISLALLLGIVIFIPRFLSNFSNLNGENLFSTLSLFSLQRLWFFILNLIALIIFIAILWRIYGVIRGKHEPLVDDFRVGLKKVFYVFIAAIIENAIVIVTISVIIGTQMMLQENNLLFSNYPLGILFTCLIFFAQIALILYVSTLFIFLIPLIAIENKGILNALQRSAQLVWNHWWRTFSVQMTPWISYLIVLILLRIVLNINLHIYFTPNNNPTILASLLQLIIFILFIPWAAALLLVQLKDLELRKDTHARRRR